MEKLLTEKETAMRLGLHVQTLRNWRHLGKGIPYIKIGAAVRYDETDIHNAVEASKIHPNR